MGFDNLPAFVVKDCRVIIREATYPEDQYPRRVATTKLKIAVLWRLSPIFKKFRNTFCIPLSLTILATYNAAL